MQRRKGPALFVSLFFVTMLTLTFLGMTDPFGGQDEESEEQEGPIATLAMQDWPMSASAVRGKVVYAKYCIGCHGEEGLGDGEAADYLNPRPRNFQKGYYKFRTTASSRLPTHEDLMRTVECGLVGSSMPGFPLVSEYERRDVVDYVMWLTTYGLAKAEVDYLIDSEELSMEAIKKDHLPDIRKRIKTDHLDRAVPVAIPPGPPSSPESIARGQARYLKECALCHGKGGLGDGGSSYALRDWKESEIVPRDLTSGVYRAGSTPRDLFIRLRTGVNGTPMPAISGSDADLWDLVHFMVSLRNPDRRPVGVTGHCLPEEDGR